MAEKQKNESFQVLREGFAKARFGGTISGCPLPGMDAPINFAPAGGEENGGLNPEEYVARHFRILSATVTPYRFFDFTRPGVLKAAVPLFEKLTLYANHSIDVTRWKGFTQGPLWDDQNDPQGINCLLAADKIVDPSLARGVETGALRACSVTIWFEFEKSHPNLDCYWSRLGEVVDGEVVRLIVTKITNAGEVSIVWEGEDPYAKALEAGASGAPDHNNTEEEKDMKLTAATMALLGIAAGTELSAELLEGKINETVTGLKTKIAGLEPEAQLGKQLLEETRTRAETLYKVLKGEGALERFITGVIRTADLATARALCEEYEQAVESKVPLACPKCGEKLKRQSSRPAPEGHAAGGKRAADYKL
ncbi:hypothetical protein [Geobacter sp. SVR]|uniref:hypothetical protein n=1 Tax=Geobacter sp. SVR TaxID=2495594 RepID=UPI001950DD03|nr:hypothetical protein [Geobacter sp. SVR]BCS54552.1 hypothetical protein GSVR_28600 [Geobacter sp. SVR]